MCMMSLQFCCNGGSWMLVVMGLFGMIMAGLIRFGVEKDLSKKKKVWG